MSLRQPSRLRRGERCPLRGSALGGNLLTALPAEERRMDVAELLQFPRCHAVAHQLLLRLHNFLRPHADERLHEIAAHVRERLPFLQTVEIAAQNFLPRHMPAPFSGSPGTCKIPYHISKEHDTEFPLSRLSHLLLSVASSSFTMAISSQLGNFGQSMQSFHTFCGRASFVTVWKPSVWKKPGL